MWQPILFLYHDSFALSIVVNTFHYENLEKQIIEQPFFRIIIVINPFLRNDFHHLYYENLEVVTRFWKKHDA
jgi:hypothetical protein